MVEKVFLYIIIIKTCLLNIFNIISGGITNNLINMLMMPSALVFILLMLLIVWSTSVESSKTKQKQKTGDVV